MSHRSPRRWLAAGLSLTVAAVGLTAGATGSSAASPSATFTAAADSYVSQANPTTTHGSYDWLATCPATCSGVSSSERDSFLTFNVAGVPADAQNVAMSLTLTPRNSGQAHVSVSSVIDTWDPATLNWNNRPRVGAQLSSVAVAGTGPVTWNVSSAVPLGTGGSANGSFALELQQSDGAEIDWSSTRSGPAPQLTVTWTTAPVNTGPLPFTLPDKTILQQSPHLVFAHYMPAFPISIDNDDPSVDYYARNFLNPDGEGGKHKAYGGFIRERPLPRAQLSGDWQLTDMETDVQRAEAAGIDGFTVDILNLTDAKWTSVQTLIKAAHLVDPNFKIVPMPDGTTSDTNDQTTLGNALIALAADPAVYHLADGRLVLSPYMPEHRGLAFWTALIAQLNAAGITVAFVPVFLEINATLANSYAPISYGMSDWGNRSPGQQGGQAAHAKLAHDLGKIWMQPVSTQDEVPNIGAWDEADNTEQLRMTWQVAITNAEWVQLPTWNDYAEGAEIAPSTHIGYTYLDLTSYYLTQFKLGTAPVINKDVVYVTSRVQFHTAKPTYPETLLMNGVRTNSSAPRDDVEVLTFLTAPATVSANIGGTVHTYQAPAGVYAQLFPLAYGTDQVTVSRGGVTTATVTPAWTVTPTPYVQDLQYWGASSAR